MKSKLLEYIKNNPETWEEELNRKLIKTNHKGDRVCFKYGIEADFSDPLVCEARGIIIDIKKREVVCRPFDKFFNEQEQYAADIDWNTARVLEKIDGSLIKLYWYDGNWVFATGSTCDASDAPVAGYKDLSFRDVIASADNYGKIPYDTLDKDYTYLFELVSPFTQVLIKYNTATLYFLAARNNSTGEETDGELEGFKRPKDFPLKTVDECIKAAEALNNGPENGLTDEGFVVVDENHNRIKIKSPAYIAMHRVSANRFFTSKRMINMYFEGIDFVKLAKDFPNEAHIIKYYDWQFAEVRHKVKAMAAYAGALYEEYDHDRRAVASMIKDSPYAWAGFAALDNNKEMEEILQMLNPARLEKLVEEYGAHEKQRSKSKNGRTYKKTEFHP